MSRSVDWEAKLRWAEAEHDARTACGPGEDERPDFHTASIAGASWAAGLAALMLGRTDEGRTRLRRAADEYRSSWEEAPPGAWGRPIASLRCRLIAGDLDGARVDAAWAIDAGAGTEDGAVPAYCGALAFLVLGRYADAQRRAASLQGRDDFQPGAVADALVAVAAGDEASYCSAAAAVLGSFEERDAFLEDVRVADTVLVLDALAAARGMAASGLASPLLPAISRRE